MRAFELCFLFLCLLSVASYAKATKNLRGFSIDLIHRGSPLSPFYNPSLTPSERIRNAALRSIARSKHLGLTQNEDGYPKTITIPDEPITEYLMRFYIGTPPVERFAIADTGSDLIWVQCSPCVKCVPQNAPLFNPKKSSTYKNVPCDSQPCTILPPNQRVCGKSGECIYAYQYGDKTLVQGIMGFESINFGSKDGGSNVIKFPKLTFGCTYYNNDTADESKKNTGLVGLGVGPLSLISQLGNQIGRKFSYCFPPLSSNLTSKLKFGEEAIIKGKRVVSTPLIIKSTAPSFYYLNLEGISVGNRKLKTNKTHIDGNILIDSGTSFTILKQSFYDQFVTLVKEVYGVEAEKNPPAPFNFCFRNKDNRKHFPDIAFHFTGAKVRLDTSNLFEVDGKLFCLVVSPTSEDDDPIYGNYAQANFQVEYDLEGGKISFAPADDCAKA